MDFVCGFVALPEIAERIDGNRAFHIGRFPERLQFFHIFFRKADRRCKPKIKKILRGVIGILRGDHRRRRRLQSRKQTDAQRNDRKNRHIPPEAPPDFPDCRLYHSTVHSCEPLTV